MDELINNVESNGNRGMNREREYNEVPIHLDIGLNRNRDNESIDNNMNSNEDVPVSVL